MSAAALQRVVVRMLHDPAFIEQVRTRGCDGLTEVELAWVRAVDPRRWRADPMRRYRLLLSLLEEFPVACAVVVRRVGVPALERFLSSAAFHGAIEAGEVLAFAFGAWLQAGFGREVAALAELEEAVARVRRCSPPTTASSPTASGRLALSPGYVPLTPPIGTLTAWQAVLTRLDTHPQDRAAAVIDPRWKLPPIPLGPTTESLLIQPGPEIGRSPEPLIAFLRRLPGTDAEAHTHLVELGSEVDEVDEIIGDLLTDGVIRRVFAEG